MRKSRKVHPAKSANVPIGAAEMISEASARFESEVFHFLSTYGEPQDAFYVPLELVGRMPLLPPGAADDDPIWSSRDGVLNHAYEACLDHLRRSGAVARSATLALSTAHLAHAAEVAAVAGAVVQAISEGDVQDHIWRLIDKANPQLPQMARAENWPIYERIAERFIAAISDAVRTNIEQIVSANFHLLVEPM